jgi:hypothetical protein
MGEIADYFRRERYITRRLSLLVLAGTAILVPIALNAARGRLPAVTLPYAVIGVVLGVAAAVVLIVRRANALFPRSASPDELPLDDATSRKLRRRVLLLKGFVAVYAFILVSIVVHMHRGEWPGVLGASVVIVIMEAALIKAIRRLNLKLRAGARLMRNTFGS